MTKLQCHAVCPYDATTNLPEGEAPRKLSVKVVSVSVISGLNKDNFVGAVNQLLILSNITALPIEPPPGIF